MPHNGEQQYDELDATPKYVFLPARYPNARDRQRMIGADLHTAAMLGVWGAAGSGWERRGATQWPPERSNSGLNMC